MGLGLMRALMLRARGVSVFVVDWQRTGWQMLADTVLVACLLAFAYEIIAYAWQLHFHIGPSVLDRPVVEGLASHALGALIVTGQWYSSALRSATSGRRGGWVSTRVRLDLWSLEASTAGHGIPYTLPSTSGSWGRSC